MNNDENNMKEMSTLRRFWRVARWFLLAFFVLFVVVPAVVGGYMYITTPGLDERLTEMIEACEERGEGCPDYLTKFRAYQQIYLADVEVARKFAPPDVEIVSFFGMAPAAVFVVEYFYHTYDDPPTPPAGNPGGPSDILYREVDVLLLLAKGPDGKAGAWATHVLVTHPVMRKAGRSIGLPAELACGGITVEHNCGPDKAGIVFDVGPCGRNEKKDRVRSIKVCLPHGPGQGTKDLQQIVNLTMPNLTGRIAQDNAYVYGAAPHDPELKVTDFMLYLFTFWKATLRMADPVPQSVTGKGEAADIMAALLEGPQIPFAQVFDGVEATVWDLLVHEEDKWNLKKRPF